MADMRTALDHLLIQMDSLPIARASDLLLFAKMSVRENGDEEWTADQCFEATMEVYKGMVQCYKWGEGHALKTQQVEHEMETQESRQTIEWTNRPIKVKLIRE